MNYTVTLNETKYAVELRERRGTRLSFRVDGEEYDVDVSQVREKKSPTQPSSPSPSQFSQQQSTPRAQSHEIRAPMPGIISEVKVSPGDRIEVGATILIIEAMKMENAIKASRSGVIESVHVSKGQEVGNSALLASFQK